MRVQKTIFIDPYTWRGQWNEQKQKKNTGQNIVQIAAIIGESSAPRYDYTAMPNDHAHCFIAISIWKNSSNFTKHL